MKPASKNLVAVEELFLAIQISNVDDITIIDGQAIVDLAEFNLTPEEIEKFQKIFAKLNTKLALSLQQQHPASSVISEIRSTSSH